MKNYLTKHLTKGKALAVAGAAALMTTAGPAMAEPTFTPVDMGEIVFPLNIPSVAIGIATAGGAMIAAWAIYAIGFKLIRKFIRRMGAVV
ncbi:MAG: hypothetical protein ACX94C_05835 [Phycisphaerales bacterium]